jgi:alpha/beta hydrolase fold
MRTRAPAALRLRGRDGRVHTDVIWPVGISAALLVFIGETHREPICRSLAAELRAVTLSTVSVSAHDAAAALDWTADHAAELGGDLDRLIVAGVHAGAGVAASLAVRARDERWPPIAGQLLVHPHFREDELRPLDGVAPAAIATDSPAGRRYAGRLRSAGVPVAVLGGPDPFTQPVPGPAAERLLTRMARLI